MMPTGAPIGGHGGGTGVGTGVGTDIGSDIGNDSDGAGPNGPARPTTLPHPEPGLTERFQRALLRDDSPAPEMPSPMSLFGPALGAPPAPPPAPEAAPAPLPMRELLHDVERLLVSDGLADHRAVRLTLGEGALHGTQVEIAQLAGELQVVFHCADADARRRLSLHAATMSEQLSQRLQRDVRLAVDGGGSDADAEPLHHRQGAPWR